MLKYLTKIAMDVLPSVVATVIGAYIVNHYINAKPAADAPAAAVSSVDPKNANGKVGKPTETASIPEPGVKARGISEKGMIEKTASERPADAKPVETKAVETKPVESASAPADSRRHAILSREKGPSEKAAAEKSMAKTVPAANPAPAVEASAAPTEEHHEEHRDAADLARAAIERLRNMGDNSSKASSEKTASEKTASEKAAAEKAAAEKASSEKTQEAARSPEPPVVQDAPRSVAAVPLRPLPPPITVSTPPAEQPASAQPAYPPYTASVGVADPNRPTPPADIPQPPAQPPLDLRADAAPASPREHARNMADDMLSAAKSVFHAVIPGVSSSSSKFTD